MISMKYRPAFVANRRVEPVDSARGSGPVHAGYAKSSIAIDDQRNGSYWPVTCLTLDAVCLTGLADKSTLPANS